MDNQKIGRMIAAYRKRKGLTQRQLADVLGVTNKAVSKWETGQGVPDISILPALSKELAVSIDDLLTGDFDEAEETGEAPVRELFSAEAEITLKTVREYCKIVCATRNKKRNLLLGISAAFLLIFAGACLVYREMRPYSGNVPLIIAAAAAVCAALIFAWRLCACRAKAGKTYRKLVYQNGGDCIICRFYGDKFLVCTGDSVQTWTYDKVTKICRTEKYLVIECGYADCFVEFDENGCALMEFLRAKCYGAKFAKVKGVVSGTEFAGSLLAVFAVLLVLMQIVYCTIGSRLRLEYLYDSWFGLVNMLILGLMMGCLLCFFGKKKKAAVVILVAGGALLLLGGYQMVTAAYTTKTVVDLSPDYSNLLILKQDMQTGKTTVYRNGFLWFVRRHEQFPYTVKEPVKTQWLSSDACAVTYESPDDAKTHQYVATYGDRGQGSYYQVTNVLNGTWIPQNAIDWTLHADAEGITLSAKNAEEYYAKSDCTQFGTLGLTLNRDGAPRWTIVLNEECRVVQGQIESGASITVCRVSKEQTAPMNFQSVSMPQSGITDEFGQPEYPDEQGRGRIVVTYMQDVLKRYPDLKGYQPELDYQVVELDSEDPYEIGLQVQKKWVENGDPSMNKNVQIKEMQVLAGNENDFLMEVITDSTYRDSRTNEKTVFEDEENRYRIMKGDGAYLVARISPTADGSVGLEAVGSQKKLECADDPAYHIQMP